MAEMKSYSGAADVPLPEGWRQADLAHAARKMKIFNSTERSSPTLL